MGLISLSLKKLNFAKALPRVFLCVLCFCELGLPQGFSEEKQGAAKPQLSEEEDIALMMQQLERFKSSWEKKGKPAESAESAEAEVPPAAVPVPAAAAKAAAPAEPVKAPAQAAASAVQQPVPVQPLAPAYIPAVQQAQQPSIKITSPAVFQPAAGTQIKTSQGQILPAVEAQAKPLEAALPKPPAPIVKDSAEAVETRQKWDAARGVEPAPVQAPAPKPRPAVPSLDEIQAVLKKEAVLSPTNQNAAEAKPAAAQSVASAPVPAAKSAAPVSAPLSAAAPAAAKPAEKPAPAVVKAEPPPAAPSADDVIVVEDDAARYETERQARAGTAGGAPESARMQARRQVPAGSAAPVIEFAQDDAKLLGRNKPVAGAAARSKWNAAHAQKKAPAEPPKPNLFAQSFYLSPAARMAYDVYDVDGFVFVKQPDQALDTQYAVVTGFGGSAMRTRAIPGLHTLDDAKKWVQENQEIAKIEEVEVKKLTIKKGAAQQPVFWVGQKSFPTLEAAAGEVKAIRDKVTAGGGNFSQLVAEANTYVPIEDEKQVEIKTPANFAKEEELALKYLDQLDIGDQLFGPLQGEASGEKMTWQSFGETTWRRTNLTARDYKSQVGFWTNRVVFKGIRFPMSTVDPFLESTVSMDSTSTDATSNAKFFAGLEWRPFARNAWLFNYRPWGGISVLEWIRNYRFYIMYGERRNIKDPIEGSHDTDLLAGVQMFYEWGVELPPLDQPAPKTVSDYVERVVWGEYFGNYYYTKSDFGSFDDWDAIIFNSSVILGFKLPGIPLPPNPVNEELMLMPYFRFEHTNNSRFSLAFQNQSFVAAGVRWMPFRNYRYKENEWLSKTKLFAEYVGVGALHNYKIRNDVETAEKWDLRFGVSFSSRRY